MWDIFDFSISNRLFDGSVFNRALGLVVFLFLQLLASLVFQLIKSINIFVDVLGKVIVKLWQLLFLDFVNLNLEKSVLTGQFLSVVVFWEGYFNVNVITGLVTN